MVGRWRRSGLVGRSPRSGPSRSNTGWRPRRSSSSRARTSCPSVCCRVTSWPGWRPSRSRSPRSRWRSLVAWSERAARWRPWTPGSNRRSCTATASWSRGGGTCTPVAGGRPSTYAEALADLHGAMRGIEVATPSFADRVAEAVGIVRDRRLAPAAGRSRSEPARQIPPPHHPGRPRPRRRPPAAPRRTAPRQRDLERAGPRLHRPRDLLQRSDRVRCRARSRAVAVRYPDVDRTLLNDCRRLVLAMVAAWRLEPGDQLPDGERAGRLLVQALRDGPPWPTIDEVWRPTER